MKHKEQARLSDKWHIIIRGRATRKLISCMLALMLVLTYLPMALLANTGEDNENTLGYSLGDSKLPLGASTLSLSLERPEASVKYALGTNHTLMLQEDGSVYAWGENSSGQLGNDSVDSYSYNPGLVYGLTDIVDISAGYRHSLALDDNGNVWAWGENNYGQIGLGSTIKQYKVPMKVHELSNIVYITCGPYTSVAVKDDGTVYVWGYNRAGLLGIGHQNNVLSPVLLEGIEDVAEIKMGNGNGYALLQDGTVWAWGNNTYGSLGNGTVEDSTIPLKVNIDGVVSIQAGNSAAYFLKEDGSVWACGYNGAGHLGIGVEDREPYPEPIQVPGLENVRKISSSYMGHVMAFDESGDVWVWGANTQYQLGLGHNNKVYAPTKMDSVPGANDAILNGNHSLILTRQGAPWVVGFNLYGQLGVWHSNTITTPQVLDDYPNTVDLSATDGVYSALGILNYKEDIDWVAISVNVSTSYQLTYNDSEYLEYEFYNQDFEPLTLTLTERLTLEAGQKIFVKVTYNQDALYSRHNAAFWITLTMGEVQAQGKSITGNGNNGAVLTPEGTVKTWGSDQNQLGTGAFGAAPSPVDVINLENIAAISSTGDSMFALDKFGNIWGWGNVYELTGDMNTSRYNIKKTPTRTLGGGFVSFDCGGTHMLALSADGKVYSWGRNNYGQLGYTTPFAISTTPMEIPSLDNVTHVSAKNGYSVALKADGTVWTWGQNSNGQLGNGTTTNRTIPEQVTSLPPIVSINTGYYRTIAVDENGEVWIWGRYDANLFGGASNTTSPTKINGLSHIKFAAVGQIASYFLDEDGNVYAMGTGVLGNGFTAKDSTSVPVKVANLENIVELTVCVTNAVDDWALAKDAEGNIWVWGRSSNYKLGLGTNATDVLYPVILDIDTTMLTAPNLQLDIERELITGLNLRIAYEISTDGMNWSYVRSGQSIIEITNYLSNVSEVTIYVREANPVSEPISFTIAPRPEAPNSIDVSYTSVQDRFFINGVTTDMQYRLASVTTWTDGTGNAIPVTPIPEVEVVQYKVRCKPAGPNTPASQEVTVTMGRPNAPVVTEVDKVLVGTTEEMEYSTNLSSAWSDCTTDMDITSIISKGAKVIKVRYKRTDTAPASIVTVPWMDENFVSERITDLKVISNYSVPSTVTGSVYYIDYAQSIGYGQYGQGEEIFELCARRSRPGALSTLIAGPFSVTGILRDVAGNPLPNKAITIEIPLTRGQRITGTATTDSSGSFTYRYSGTIQEHYPTINDDRYYGDVYGQETPWALSDRTANTTDFYAVTAIKATASTSGATASVPVAAKVGHSTVMRLGDNWYYGYAGTEMKKRWHYMAGLS